MDILNQLKHFMRLEDPQDVLNLLNDLSIDQVKENSGTVKAAIMFILFKKRVSTDIAISDLGHARLDRKEWKKFSTATIKEFKQHIVENIFISMYEDAVVMKTVEDFDQFLKTSKEKISKSFKTSGGDFIESIEYVLEYP